MNKTIALTAVLAALSGGAVLAADAGVVAPYGPQSIADVRAAGQGAIVGTVIEIDPRGFVLADASDRVRVATRHMAADAVQPGQQATVQGRMDHGEMKARQIVREDGTPAPRHGQARQGGHESRHGMQEGRHAEQAPRHGMQEGRHAEQERGHGKQESRREQRDQEHHHDQQGRHGAGRHQAD